MVGRQRTVARRKRRAAEIAQLFGMQLDRQAQFCRLLEDPLDLIGREGDVLAETVDRIGQPGIGGGGQHLSADEVDVIRRSGPCIRAEWHGRRGNW